MRPATWITQGDVSQSLLSLHPSPGKGIKPQTPSGLTRRDGPAYGALRQMKWRQTLTVRDIISFMRPPAVTGYDIPRLANATFWSPGCGRLFTDQRSGRVHLPASLPAWPMRWRHSPCPALEPKKIVKGVLPDTLTALSQSRGQPCAESVFIAAPLRGNTAFISKPIGGPDQHPARRRQP